MKSPNRDYIPELDQLRAFAAVLVLFYHTVHTGRAAIGADQWPQGNPLSSLLYEGHTGVALFMVLSGFVLARGALGVSLDYSQFIRNRALRILPLMTFVVVFAVYGNTDVTLSGIIAPFLFLSNTTPRLFSDVTNLSGTVWTIAIEFQFYLIAPFLFAFVAQRGIRYLLALMAFAWIARMIVLAAHWGNALDLYMISYYTIVGRLNQFMIGIGLAYLWPQIETSLGRHRLLVLGGSLAAAIALCFVVNRGGGQGTWHPWMVVYRELEALAWAGVIAGFVMVRPLQSWRLSTFATRVGVISFSIYILHWPLEQLFWKLVVAKNLAPNTSSLWILLIYSLALLPAVLFVSWLSYTAVERPFLEMRRRYVRAPASVVELPREAAHARRIPHDYIVEDGRSIRP